MSAQYNDNQITGNSALEPINGDHVASISRRDSLKLLAALVASSLLPSLTGCEPSPTSTPTTIADAKTHWPQLQLAPITSKGYGKDPTLIQGAPWPLTMTPAQLGLTAIVCDILLPRDGQSPSASELNVPTVLDEWISAPYPDQQSDRVTLLSVLAWLNDEATQRFGVDFKQATSAQRLQIIDDIAYNKAENPERFARIIPAFSRFRSIAVAAYYCTPTGSQELGYLGNVPIAGDYPGPSAEAKAHLSQVLAKLGLSEYA
jgi:hypothetical protein